MSLKIKTFFYVLGTVLILLIAHGDAARASDKGSEEIIPPHEFQYLQLAPISMPLMTKGVMQQISMVVSLEIKYGSLDKIKYIEPKLTDAYIQDLYALFESGQGLIDGKVVNANVVKDRLIKVTKTIKDAEDVNDVLLQVINQRTH
jgi:hypothetical protein